MGQLTQTTAQVQTILDNSDAANVGKTSLTDSTDTTAVAVKKSGFYSLGASSSNAPSTDRAILISAVRDTAATGEIRYGQVAITESNGMWWNRDDGGSLGTWYEAVSTAGTQTLTNKTLTSPVLTTPQINDTSADHQYIFAVSELAADRTVTLPLLTGNDTFVFAAHTQTLTNKTLTSPVFNTGVSGSAVLDDDTFATASATTLATSESIKAYVDTQLTAEDLDFAGDTGTGAVDLDSQTFTIAGTANEIETSATGQTLTIGLPNSVTITTALSVDTISEKTAAAGVTVDSLLIKDGGITAAGTSTFAGQTISDLGTVTTANIDGGSIDGTTIGASTAAAITGTTGQFNTSLNVDGTITADGLTVDGSAVVEKAAVNYSTGVFSSPHIALKASVQPDDNDGFVGATFATSDSDNYGWSAGAERTTGGAGDFVLTNHFNSATGTQSMRLHAGGDISFYEDTGTTAKFFWDASAESLGIGTASPAELLHIESGTNGEQVDIRFRGLTTSAGAGRSANIGFDPDPNDTGTSSEAQLYLSADTTNKTLVATAAGNVGIGVAPSAWSTLTTLQVKNAHLGGYVDNAYFGANCYYDGSNWRYIATNEASRIELASGEVQFWNAPSGTAGNAITFTQAMTLDSSGNLLVGTTDTTPWDNSTATSADDGIFLGGGRLGLAKWGGVPLLVNRTDSDGEIAIFYKDGTAVGSIGTNTGILYIGSGEGTDAYLGFGNDIIRPVTSAGASRDNAIDLGYVGMKFKDIHAGGRGFFNLYSSGINSGNIMVGEGVYVGAANGDNQIRSSSAGGGSATLYIGNAAIQVSSDQRLKTNIVDTEMNATEKLNQVRVVDFNWDDPSDTSFNNRNARGKWTGVLAQELVDILPFAVNAPRNEEDLTIDAESDQKWLVDQAQMVPVLIKAIQELTARITALEGAN